MLRAATVLPYLATLALLACAPAPPPPPPVVAEAAPVQLEFIKPGIYETVDPSLPRVRIYLYLSPNHGFILRWTKEKESIVEYRGAWTSDPDSLRLQVYDVRRPREDFNYGRAERMDTTIACPIQHGASFPVPILKLAGIKSGPRLVQMAKPQESGSGWEGDKPARKSKGKKTGRTASKPGKPAKGGNGKDTSSGIKVEADIGDAPKPGKPASAPKS